MHFVFKASFSPLAEFKIDFIFVSTNAFFILFFTYSPVISHYYSIIVKNAPTIG